MSIKLFELRGDKVLATEHCYNIKQFKEVIDNYPDNYLKILAFVFYMSCRSAENPYFNRPSEDLDIEILRDLGADFSVEDPLIVKALDKAKDLYETPTVRAYNGFATMLDKLALYLETQDISDGRDGNISAIVQAAKNFDNIRKSFKGVAKDLEEEQSSRARGGSRLSYDD
ncbi:MAG: hypothetical protein RIR01_2369 [Bacteroidota bacterium]|jgi:hypothetical protein